jgi:hypothetical protein
MTTLDNELLDNSLLDIYNDLVIKIKDLNNKKISIKKIEEIFIFIENYEIKIQKIKNQINKIENLKSQFKLLYMNKIKSIKDNINNINNIKINENTGTDNGNNYYKIKNINLTNDENYNNNKYYTSPVIIISENSMDKIINTPIYMIKETNEFCLKINNKIIKGNIGNIVDKHNKKKIKKCNRLYCNNTFFNKKECKFYHENDNEKRNFPDYSWKSILKNKYGTIKYKNKKIELNNYDIENTRFIGSLDTLNQDLVLTSIFEKKLRNKQLMHDILLYQILDNYLE